MFLVDDDEPDIGERREDGEPGSDNHVNSAGPDAPPFVGPLAIRESAVEHGHADLEVGPKAVHERQRQCHLGDEQERRSAGRHGGLDRLDVDRGLPPAGDPVEQEWRGVALLDRPDDRRQRLGLRRHEVTRRWASSAHPRRPRGERRSRCLDDRDPGQSAFPQRRDHCTPVAFRNRGGGDPGRARDGQLFEGRALPGTEAPRRTLRCRLDEVDEAQEPRACAGVEQCPVEVHEPRACQAAEAAQEARPPLGAGEAPNGLRAGIELLQEREVGRRRRLRRCCGPERPRRQGVIGPPLRHELEALQEAGREHRPQDERGWGDVGLGNRRGEVHGERRQQRAVGTHPVRDGLDLDARRGLPGTEDDAEGLAPAEVHEHRLATLEGLQGRGDVVGERVVAGGAGSVDGHRHVSPGVRPNLAGTRGRLPAGARGRPLADARVLPEGELAHLAGQTRVRRPGCAAFSAAMISWIWRAVRSICPVSFTTTWS